jgi:4-carboxymuconolactone decarboxylase
MSTPRIAPLEPPYPADIAARFAAIMPAGMEPLKLFRTLARNERVLQRFLAGGLLDRGSISLGERELVILRTCARCGSEYEWGVHVQIFAAKAGLSEAQVAAAAHGTASDPAWSPRQALLVRLVDELHDEKRIPAPLWAELAHHWSPEQLVELVVLAGSYTMVSLVTTAFEIELERTAERFPAAPGR